MAVTTITSENFESVVLKSDKTALIDFWASWCGPCMMMSPIIDEIAEENGDILVGKVNVDEQGDLAAEFGIMSIPTFMIFKNGELAETVVGTRSKEDILALLK